MHHAFADTEKDPHSPKYSANPFTMLMETKDVYFSILNKEKEVEPRFTRNVPEWASFDKFANAWLVRMLWGAFYVWFYMQFATATWMYALLPIHLFMAPVHGTIVNWYAHKYGYRSYEMSNTATNLLPLDLLMMGESYHNNHHKNDSSPNFGSRWHELDPTYYIILLLNFLGIIQVKKS